jgi:hypothetical protein
MKQAYFKGIFCCYCGERMDNAEKHPEGTVEFVNGYPSPCHWTMIIFDPKKANIWLKAVFSQ